MKKITLFFIVLMSCVLLGNAQHVFTGIPGPENVAEGSPVVLNINDAANVAAVPAGLYSSFSVSADWANDFNAWSSEAEFQLTTAAGSVDVAPPTSGSADNGDATTLTFESNLAGAYDPSVDGTLDITLSQAFGGSSADWSNILVTLFPAPDCGDPVNIIVVLNDVSTSFLWSAPIDGIPVGYNWEIQPDGVAQGTAGALASGSGAAMAADSGNVLTASTAYEFYVQTDCGPDGTSSYATVGFTTTAIPTPPNDSPFGAIPIVPAAEGDGCTATFSLPFDTDGTTDSGIDPPCAGTPGKDQFFTWTATSVALLWNDLAPGNPGIAVWDAATLTPIACADTFAAPDVILSGWTVGQDLVIQIFDFGTSNSTVAFCLEEFTPPPPPANDNCAGVIDLGALTSPITATTEAANNDFNQDCLTNLNAPDVVYSILVPDGFELTIGQTVNAYDSKHRVAYGATCPGDMLIACIDDPDVGQVEWTNTTGGDQTVYWIQSAFSTGSGEFTLSWMVSPPCDAEAGTLTADANPVELNGSTTISATEDTAPVVPAGFTTLYVLTSGPTLLIEQTNATPSFDVTVANDYTIHTLVYDPNTLDPGSLPPGATGVDVNNLLIQGGGTICGALDVAGAPITVSECLADAGTLTADSSQVVLSGTTTISATEDTAPFVPAGFTTLYVLTSGPTLLIEQTSATPSFDVTVANDYTIHTLVYDPNTLDPGTLPPGATGVDVNNLLIQGGGTICGALDVAGAPVSVIDPASLEELLTVDLSTANEVTITATSGLSFATASGSDTTGFLLADFFVNAGTQALGETLVSGDLTSASETSDGTPDLFRAASSADVGLNIWSYTNDPTSNFTAGQVAFSGQATWTLPVDAYNAFLTAPDSGLIYFPADSSDDIAGSTLIGVYSVLLPLSIDDVEANAFTYFPNPVKNTLTLSAQNNIETVTMFNMLGQEVLRAAPNNIDSELDMSGLNAGTYFVRVTIANTTQTIKVVKQ